MHMYVHVSMNFIKNELFQEQDFFSSFLIVLNIQTDFNASHIIVYMWLLLHNLFVINLYFFTNIKI